MRVKTLLVLVAAIQHVISFHLTHPVSRECNKTIRSEEEAEGVVEWTGYPGPSTTCTYTFLGTAHHKLQLTFTSFALREPPPHLAPHERCLHTDALAVYNVVNNDTLQEIDTFCGHSVPLPVMSSTPGLHLVFTTKPAESHGVTSLPTPTGFSAKFKFVKNFGMRSGQQAAPGVCQFVYNSSQAANGTLYSPNPQGYYPQDTTCNYLFYGRPGEVVRLTFKYFDVEGVMPCNEATDSDYLEFSNFPSADRKIPPFCGNVAPTFIQSDGSFFRLTFKSNNKFSGTGFAADYQFLDLSYQPYTIKKVIVMTSGGSGVACGGGTVAHGAGVLLLLVQHMWKVWNKV